jgi:hypothetical protein
MPTKSDSSAPGETAEEFSRKLPIEDIKENWALEAYHCLDALRIWEDAFRPKYGELLSLTHRFGGDDPPDVDAVFERGTVPMEHTCVEPENRRKAHALLPNQMRRVIPAANKVKSVKGIRKASNPWGQDAFTDVIPEAHANYDLIAKAMREKMGKCSRGAVIVLESHSGSSCEWTVEPARVAFDLIKRESGWEKYAFVLLARDNPVSYASAFISAERPFEIRRFSPPPMTDEERSEAWKKLPEVSQFGAHL